MDERDHLLGLHGHAMLRSDAAGDASAVAAHRQAMRELLAAPASGRTRSLRPVSVGEGYAYWARSYDDRVNATIAVEQAAVRSLLADLPYGDAVDVGCGTGRHTSWLIEAGHQVTAVDASPDMLAVAQTNAPQARTILGDVQAVPLPDGCADIVVCALVLSHLPALDSVRELARLLRPGGRLVISNPHPFATSVLGARAWTITPSGERVSIPEFAHPLGAYVDAFHRSGLIPVKLIEPRHPADQELLKDEPAVVVWAADRPRGRSTSGQ
jgi:SAM-dependent methyltransferase